MPDDRSDNCYHVVTVVGPGGAGLDDVCIEGVTIRDGNADAGGAAAPLGRDNLGGGLLLQRTKLDVADVRFRENTATFGGGMGVGGLDEMGFTSQGAELRMKTSRFVLNAATASGGGLYFGTKNLAEQVANCTFRSNRAGADGGGLFVAEHVSIFDLVNAVVIENGAAARGGGAFVDARSDPGSTLVQMVNCTVAFNSVGGPQSGAGVYLQRAAGTAPGPGMPKPRALRNTIVHANPEFGTPDNVFAESQLPVDYSNSFIGNLAVNPIPAPTNFILAAAFPGLEPGWVNPAQRNLRLGTTSVCIDQGSDLLLPGSNDATDLDLDQDFDEFLPRDFVLTDSLLVGGDGTSREVASDAGTTPPIGDIGVDGGAATNAICDIGAYEHRYIDVGLPVQ